MNPTSTPVQVAGAVAVPDRQELLRCAAIEQVMRCSDDDLAVLALLDVPPGTSQAAATLGRLMTESPQRLVAGCPLIALVTGADPDPHWRDAYPASPTSLHAHLDFLISLYGSPAAPDPYTALEILRARSDADLPMPDLPGAVA